MAGRRAALALAVALATGACTTSSSHYYWGDYNQTLYAHYRAPQERTAWVEGLKTTILTAEQRGLKVPPGIYAEYGYALFEEGDAKGAVAYFQREAALWPEARFFMEKMIRNAEQRGGQPRPPAQGPAGATEQRS